jgi:Tfp pilus assembly ATPase PilU
MKSAGNGMQTFDQDLYALHRQQFITGPEALRHATNPEALTMQLRGISAGKSAAETQRQNQGFVKPAPRPPVAAAENHHHG